MPRVKRRSLSQSSSDEDIIDVKRNKKYVSKIEDIDEDSTYFDVSDVKRREHHHKSHGKSEVVLLDCKRLDDGAMFTMYSIDSNTWLTLPMRALEGTEADLMDCIDSRNVIGFLHSNIIFWKDQQTLISLNVSSYAIKTVPSMSMGSKTTVASTWKYLCALDKLIAVNVFASEKLTGNYEKAVINIMTYSFRDGGWEKLAEHHFEKRCSSTPYVLTVENRDGLWICVADYFMNSNTFAVEKHGLHLLFIENHSWGLDEIECEVVSNSYRRTKHFPTIGVDDKGRFSILTKPDIYRYDMKASKWLHSRGIVTKQGTGFGNNLPSAMSIQGLSKFYFKIDESEESCDFCEMDLETGESRDLEPPPINVYQNVSKSVLIKRGNMNRITNDVESSKMSAFLIKQSILQWTKWTVYDQFECEF